MMWTPSHPHGAPWDVYNMSCASAKDPKCSRNAASTPSPSIVHRRRATPSTAPWTVTVQDGAALVLRDTTTALGAAPAEGTQAGATINCATDLSHPHTRLSETSASSASTSKTVCRTCSCTSPSPARTANSTRPPEPTMLPRLRHTPRRRRMRTEPGSPRIRAPPKSTMRDSPRSNSLCASSNDSISGGS